MSTIDDKEFGTIVLQRSVKARSVRIRVAPNGKLRVSMPLYMPVMAVKRFLNTSRGDIRRLVENYKQSTTRFSDGMQIGKSHTLITRPTSGSTTVRRHGQQIVVSLHHGDTLDDDHVASDVRQSVIAVLRLEAKSYLPKRLAYLAEQAGFYYDNVRFSHASGRWGSCSTSGTISLNIALMKLPFELIDYVLIHELAHTKQMNHSPAFWELVEAHDPHYKTHRQMLKRHTPSI